jgi:hydrogenase maturation factor
LESGPLKAGKLPAGLLDSLLHGMTPGPEVLLGGAVGVDAAVIDFTPGSAKYLVAKTDPITFATDRAGYYAVHVNANDIACMGGVPRWFLATALLPDGTEVGTVREIFEQIEDACVSIGVSLVGGHTEITPAVNRPIVIGCMLGEVAASGLLSPRNARAGDALILTQGVAIEGTAVLAREAVGQLLAAGLTEAEIAAAADLLDRPGISVLSAAGALRGQEGLHTLHDPTEGGVATAIRELATATGLGLKVEVDDVTVLPETSTVCEALGLDPLGLLASGGLLVVVSAEGSDEALSRLDKEGIPATVIGWLVDGAGIFEDLSALPVFERDELARYLDAENERF